MPVILDRLRRHSAGKPVDVSVRVNGAIAVGFILGGYKEAEHKVVKDAISVLRKFLKDSQTIVRYRGVQALGRIGTEAKDTIPEIINLVTDYSTWETRQQACIALGQIALDDVHGPSVGVLNALYSALGDGSVQVRLGGDSVLDAARRAGQCHRPPALRQGARSGRDQGFRTDGAHLAHMAVMSITRTVYKDRVDVIAQMVSHQDLAARAQALQALGSMGKDAKGTIPIIMRALRDPEPTVVGWAIWALGRIGPAANVALVELERFQNDTSQPEAIHNLADEAVSEIKGKKK